MASGSVIDRPYTPPEFSVLPAMAVHVERFYGGTIREVCPVTIVRATKTQWIDSDGGRWRKDTGECLPSYMKCRYLMSVS